MSSHAPRSSRWRRTAARQIRLPANSTTVYAQSATLPSSGALPCPATALTACTAIPRARRTKSVRTDFGVISKPVDRPLAHDLSPLNGAVRHLSAPVGTMSPSMTQMKKNRLPAVAGLLVIALCALFAVGCGDSKNESLADKAAETAEQEAKNQKPIPEPTAI